MSLFDPLTIGRLTLDPNDCTMTVGRIPVRVPLSAMEWRLMLALAEARGERVGSARMFGALWGDAGRPEAMRISLRVLTHRLRHKLREAGLGIVILTERAPTGTGDAGYRLDPEVVR